MEKKPRHLRDGVMYAVAAVLFAVSAAIISRLPDFQLAFWLQVASAVAFPFCALLCFHKHREENA